MPQSRVQVYRSSVVGDRPTSGEPGTLFVNYADGQFGVLDTASDPVDLLAIPGFRSTATYAAGDWVKFSGDIWRARTALAAGAFNAANWISLSEPPAQVGAVAPTKVYEGLIWLDTSGTYPLVKVYRTSILGFEVAGQDRLPLAGGTVTGDLQVNGYTRIANGGSSANPNLQFGSAALGIHTFSAADTIEFIIDSDRVAHVAATAAAGTGDTIITQDRGDARYPQLANVTSSISNGTVVLRTTNGNVYANRFVMGDSDEPGSFEYLAVMEDFVGGETAIRAKSVSSALSGMGVLTASEIASAYYNKSTSDTRYLNANGDTATGFMRFSNRLRVDAGGSLDTPAITLGNDAMGIHAYDDRDYMLFKVKGTEAARIIEAGTSLNDDKAVVTKQKADNRYVQLSDLNTLIRDYLVSRDPGDIGSYVWASKENGNTIEWNEEVSGSNLVPAGVSQSGGAADVWQANFNLSGTWKAHGVSSENTDDFHSTLLKRIE